MGKDHEREEVRWVRCRDRNRSIEALSVFVLSTDLRRLPINARANGLNFEQSVPRHSRQLVRTGVEFSNFLQTQAEIDFVTTRLPIFLRIYTFGNIVTKK